MTLGEMVADLTDNLTLEEQGAPSTERAVRLLNKAKNQVAGLRDRYDRNWALRRVDYTVAQGAAAVTLPDGTGDDPPVRRLRGADWVDAGRETPVNVYDYGDTAEKDYGESGFYLIREGAGLYFDGPSGAPRAMTLRVRYAALPADLDATDLTAEYAGLTDSWSEAIVSLATVLGLPAAGKGGRKWADVWQAQAEQLQAAACAALDMPLTIRRAGGC
jgi:hypothetical protein